jgi:HAD superfamily hydrolase (TIGR01509 family)
VTSRRAVIFDHDGVLVDSEPLHRVAWDRTFGPRGLTVSEADFLWSIGRSDSLFTERVVEKYGADVPAEVLRREKWACFLDLLATESETFDGLLDLLAALAATRTLGIASSAWADAIEITVRRFDIADRFDAIVSNEDVERHKPEPDPYLLCAERLGVAPSRCVAVEDSVMGVASARAARMRVVAFTSTFPSRDLADADAVIDGFADTDAVVRLVEELEESSA